MISSIVFIHVAPYIFCLTFTHQLTKPLSCPVAHRGPNPRIDVRFDGGRRLAVPRLVTTYNLLTKTLCGSVALSLTVMVTGPLT